MKILALTGRLETKGSDHQVVQQSLGNEQFQDVDDNNDVSAGFFYSSREGTLAE